MRRIRTTFAAVAIEVGRFSGLEKLVSYWAQVRSAGSMTPYAPVVAYGGGRAELKALLRLAVSPLVDMRDPIQVAYSRIAARTEELVV